MTPKCGWILFLVLFVPNYIETGSVKNLGGNLNEYISHYETLNYDHHEIHASHSRAKRSVTKDPYVNLKFRAHNRPFHIRLKRDVDTFSDNLVVETPNGELPYVDTSHVYHGQVLGEPNSHVFGSIHDGVFEGKIITENNAYYIEHAKRYFPNGTHRDYGFHSVIYNERDVVDDPFAHKRKPGHSNGCGITDDVAQWMENVQSAGIDDSDDDENDDDGDVNANASPDEANKNGAKTKPPQQKQQAQQSQNSINAEDDSPHFKYTKEANFRYDGTGASKRGSRAKRAARPKEDNRNTCSLYIQTDPLIWRHIREGIADHDRIRKSDIDEKTREEILSLIAHHVTAVNYIYRNTKFDGRFEHRNIRFEVQRIKIDDDSACSESYNGDINPFCMENIDVSNFLNLHSLGNHEFFCLAYVFTYRDFTGGTLGLAWVASASGASGGICEKYKTYTETVGGLYQSTKRSLNTGIITFVNYNSRVPPKVSQLTLAHEIGHNFGSPHDYPQECRPGGLSGNYIMFASATSGDRPNNSKFSTCSIRNISNVLDAIEDSKKRNCFTASEGAFCGNKIVEIGEECDCGFNDEECQDKCCYPRLISDADMSVNSSARGCTRRAYTQCSPSQGPCCLSEKCMFVPANYHQKCKEETECSWSSTCNGTTPECPEPKPRDDKTKCNNGTQLCINGECSGSICLLWNMTECFLTSSQQNIDKRKLCELACQNGNDTSTCRSTSEFGLEVGLPAEGISLRPGSPCDNFQGYCDVFLKCRAVDAEGPLVRLKNLLFNKHTLNTVQEWVTDYWYICVLCGIIFIIVMGIFIKCCAVHTPSSNPKKPPARRFSETLRRPMHTLRRMRHPSGHHRYPPGPRSIPPPRGSGDESFGHVSRSNASRSNHAQPHGSRSSHSNRNVDPRRQHQSSSGGSRPSSGSRPTSASHHGYDDGRGADLPVNYNRRANCDS